MEKVNILGVDPSLRNTGLAIITYDTEKRTRKVHHCQTIVNPQKYTGNDAILNMLDMLTETKEKFPEYASVDTVLIESPGIMFNKTWSQGTISLMAHVSGGAAVVFGIEKVHLFKPNEWNKSRKKDVTHNNTIAMLGAPDKWHYANALKSDKYLEHVLDAASLALFWLRNNYDYEEQ